MNNGRGENQLVAEWDHRALSLSLAMSSHPLLARLPGNTSLSSTVPSPKWSDVIKPRNEPRSIVDTASASGSFTREATPRFLISSFSAHTVSAAFAFLFSERCNWL